MHGRLAKVLAPIEQQRSSALILARRRRIIVIALMRRNCSEHSALGNRLGRVSARNQIKHSAAIVQMMPIAITVIVIIVIVIISIMFISPILTKTTTITMMMMMILQLFSHGLDNMFIVVIALIIIIVVGVEHQNNIIFALVCSRFFAFPFDKRFDARSFTYVKLPVRRRRFVQAPEKSSQEFR
jgi:hypothetical protein